MINSIELSTCVCVCFFSEGVDPRIVVGEGRGHPREVRVIDVNGDDCDEETCGTFVAIQKLSFC